jgi:hypothetical protein
LLLGTAAAAGQELYCAFQVKVTTPSGAPVARVPVAMILSNRTTRAETTTNSTGIARLCDAPIEAVDIVVGVDLCGSVLVRQVKAEWPSTREVFVTYVTTFCDHVGVAGDCQVVARIYDEGAHPLAGAKFAPRGSPPKAESGASDSLGRLFLSVKRAEKVEGTILKEGYGPVDFSSVCTDDIEPKIVLRKR